MSQYVIFLKKTKQASHQIFLIGWKTDIARKLRTHCKKTAIFEQVTQHSFNTVETKTHKNLSPKALVLLKHADDKELILASS